MRSTVSFWTIFEGGPWRLAALLGVAWVLIMLQSFAAQNPSLCIDLGTLVVVYVALESAPLSGAVASLLVGYLADVFSGESRGLTSASMMVAFVLVRLIVVRSTGARWPMITAVSVAGTILTAAARLLIENLIGPGHSSLAGFAPSLTSLIAGAFLLGYPTYKLLRVVDDRFRRREDDALSLLPRR